MSCEEIRRTIVDHGWSRADLLRMTAIVEHIDACAACHDALIEYEELHDLLEAPEPSREPEGGGERGAFERRLVRSARRPWILLRCALVLLGAVCILAAVGWILYLRGG